MSPNLVQEVRVEGRQAVVAEAVSISEKLRVNPTEAVAANGFMGDLANYSGLSGLKRDLDDLNDGVQKTVRMVNLLWEKKGWVGLAIGGSYVGAPLLRVAMNLARGRPDAAVGALVRYEVAKQPMGSLEVAVGEA